MLALFYRSVLSGLVLDPALQVLDPALHPAPHLLLLLLGEG